MMSSSNAETTLPPFDHSRTSQRTGPPNPGWAYGQKVDASPDGKEWVAQGERAGWTTIDTKVEPPPKLYQLMLSGIIPRPVAFVSSISTEGVENIAPFSWFNMVQHYPPLISISVAIISGAMKDTADNIRATKGFTVNIISEPFMEGANSACVDTPQSVSEWPISGLTKASSTHVKAPRVAESAFSMECELFQAIDIVHPETQEKTTSLILGLVKFIHVRNDVLNERGLVDPVALRAIGRGGDITYIRTGDLFRLQRPNWSAEDVQQFVQGSERKEFVKI